VEINFFLFEWLEWIVSWVLVRFHEVLTAIGFNTDSGWAWGLSIVGLVIVIRIVLIPLFVKQIKAQRGLQLIQPQMKEIQKKYAGDRERQSQEMMKLYKETGTNPLASCLPILLQAPIFFALFQVLNSVAKNPPQARGVLTDELAVSMSNATIFGAPIADTFRSADTVSTQIVVAIMIALMTASTFITQRQLMVKNMPKDNPMAQQQKILLYVFPLMFAVFGINFPVGVLIYWLTTNVWSMGQQFYVIRNMPSPGTDAEKAYLERRAARAGKGRRLLGVIPIPGTVEPLPEPTKPESTTPAPRVQPKSQPRSKRKGPAKPPAGAASKPADADDNPQAEVEGSESTESTDTEAPPPANGTKPASAPKNAAPKNAPSRNKSKKKRR
jgi:YidC/Oxa1 family membrane protein insertase